MIFRVSTGYPWVKYFTHTRPDVFRVSDPIGPTGEFLYPYPYPVGTKPAGIHTHGSNCHPYWPGSSGQDPGAIQTGLCPASLKPTQLLGCSRCPLRGARPGFSLLGFCRSRAAVRPLFLSRRLCFWRPRLAQRHRRPSQVTRSSSGP